MNDKKLAAISQIPEGHVWHIRCTARKIKERSSQSIGRPHKFTDDQERAVIEMVLTAANTPNFPTKCEILDEIENRYHIVLTYGWIHEFLTRYQNEIAYVTVGPQEDPCLQIRYQFLEQYLALVQEHVVGVNPRLVYNINETGCSDWEQRGPYHGMVPAAWKNQQ
jgi:hypothetical protein